ncbi:TlpA family protein disulfide reductase [Pseudonocardia sp. KRD-184]|uniref:TlpA family protein disulfide reductase n=1 Tax=Pseudonocardia oceani TaxID=2792013 RepID=A0ABS6U8A9_9PSEU|nr:TlpA disulfide reductase family protein [Pseudonocardia oceani]MBW0092748.1 TlpA family protein disulfide reductase [Pseudonocardia oceani]MBW0099573.1 TlpA family protein disulfide reductase [Pseudonocardia oceani]MBW0112207.1 TlpA family protein disulfide reductase [Pseudonocardia oceani]MBW0125549.1 TlpA family protein disulfide reductase [Pseudonocardia oceani]MBW0128159.1 TlpA family protein disulfide reductase [Pseudonocardia oceani]
MRRLALAVVAVLGLALGGCSTSRDAVANDGEFTFVAPGGQTTILYDPPADRGSVRGIEGESLLDPGRTIGLDDYAGQVVVLNVWGSWCGPCREEMPDLQFVQDTVEGVSVLGLDVRDSRDAAADFVRDRGLTFDSIYDSPARTLAQLSGYPRNTTPSTLVLDKQHRVAAVYLTQIRIPELIPVVERLVAEPAA